MNGETRRKKPLWRRIVKVILMVILVMAVLFVLLLAYLTATEYKPADQEALEVKTGTAADDDSDDAAEVLPSVSTWEALSIVTWNTGYGALGDNADFFMDGGTMVRTADQARVQQNIQGISAELDDLNPDFVFLQEVDVNSDRSYHIDEAQQLTDAFAEKHQGSGASTFAWNYRVRYVPYPLPPIGKVNSGILTLSEYTVTDSARIQLPCPFRWPVRLGNLKRCLMVDRIPVTDASGQDTGRELVLINLHLEAYDSGEGKAAQTAVLRDVMEEEMNKGNYVIAGGDFNQTFSGTDDSMYPEYEGRWHCGEIDESEFDTRWQFLMDNTVPTCRSLDQSYAGKDPAAFQFYMIDGFIVSDNIQVEKVQTQDLQFVCSDHNPVLMRFTLE